MIQNQSGVQEGEDQFQQQENMQLINEVPLEEEEGESQDVTQSRKVQQSTSGAQVHQYSNQS